eukprot:1277709-Amphidinium_carterae.1
MEDTGNNKRKQQLLQHCNESCSKHERRGGNTRVDPLRLGKPPVFTGDEAAYEDWAFKLKTFMGQESTTAVQWMREMENSPDALDFDLYVEEKKKEAVALYFRLVVLTDKTVLGIVKQIVNQDGFEAYCRSAVRYAPRTIGRNLTRLTSIIDHDFGTDE